MKQYWILLLVLSLVGCTSTPPATSPSKTPAQVESSSAPVDVLIVGGGLAGLSTAYHLKKAGISYRILESTPRVGGRVRTGHYANKVQAEVGLAEFWDGNPALDIARELKVPMDESELGVSSLFVDGKLYPQIQAKNNQDYIKSLLGPDYPAFQAWDEQMHHHLQALESGSIPESLRQLQQVSMESWLKDSSLPPKARAMVTAILEPEVGTSLARISALDGIAEWHLFQGKGATPHHVVGGNQNLIEAIADHIGREHIALNHQVTNILDREQGVEVRVLDNSSFANHSFQARVVALTVPLYRLFEIQFEPRLSDTVYKAIATQHWGAYFTAHVLLDREAEKFWTFEGVNVLPMLTGGPLGVIYPGESGDNQHILVNLLVTGDFAEIYNNRTMSLDDVQKKLGAEFETRFPGISPMIRKWTFYRYHPRAIASWPVGRSRFDALSESLRKPHGHLYFGGDFTESSHSDGAARSALRMASQIRQAMGK